jgi:hypothetical protein
MTGRQVIISCPHENPSFSQSGPVILPEILTPSIVLDALGKRLSETRGEDRPRFSILAEIFK